MLIKLELDNEDELHLNFSKGHLSALQDVVKQWNFKDEVCAIEFALAILKTTKPGQLCRDGQVLLPTDVITKKPTLLP